MFILNYYTTQRYLLATPPLQSSVCPQWDLSSGERPPWRETPSGRRPPRQRHPGQRPLGSPMFFLEGFYDVTSCLVPCYFQGVSVQGVSVCGVSFQRGSLSRGVSFLRGDPPLDRQTPVKTLPSLAFGSDTVVSLLLKSFYSLQWFTFWSHGQSRSQ